MERIMELKSVWTFQCAIFDTSSLNVYRHKQSISMEFLFDNTEGSDLLFKARADSLETNNRVQHEWRTTVQVP